MKLIFRGIVQGVGFRPTIYRIAKELKINGYVLNKGSEVEVVIDKKKDEFLKKIKKNLPSIAKITDITIENYNIKFIDFKILNSKFGEKQSQIPQDIAICKSCQKEIFEKNDKRYLFPFTNCTICGARFSLIKTVPYDRERTSMANFKLCKSCNIEYKNPNNKRYHAQTISCSICGPEYRLYNKNKIDLGKKEAIKSFSKEIESGKIGVIKSWGGMHLCCKIDKLKIFRKWYKRPQKAFAIMVKNIETAYKYGEINKKEKELLTSVSKPIVLVNKKNGENVSPGLNTIGIFLPYTALHHILFSYLKSDALVMTSANIPGEPMIINNDEVFSLNADFYLLHNRDIPNRIDDSVLRTWKNNIFFIRKSRGYVPDPIKISYNKNILSVGADENITGTISHDKKIYTTQYIGNSSYYKTKEFLEKSLKHLMNLSMDKKTLDAVVCDLHPTYDSRKVAEKFSREFSVPIFEIQHDWAHAASLLFDNQIKESVIIVMEGLGYGTDGTFWGGEVLRTNLNDFKRIGHLEYIPLIGGDKATLDPRRLVYAIFKKYGKEKIFTGKEELILSKLIKNAPLSCSLGRYLDAISSYLKICTERTYNGEPAMKLEKYLTKGENKYNLKATIENNVVLVTNLFNQIDEITKTSGSEKDKADIAFSLVNPIVDGLVEIASNYAIDQNIKTIGISGGVSYNIPIVEMIENKIKKTGLKLITHNQIPNGDCGISIGQNVIIGNKIN